MVWFWGLDQPLPFSHGLMTLWLDATEMARHAYDAFPNVLWFPTKGCGVKEEHCLLCQVHVSKQNQLTSVYFMLQFLLYGFCWAPWVPYLAASMEILQSVTRPAVSSNQITSWVEPSKPNVWRGARTQQGGPNSLNSVLLEDHISIRHWGGNVFGTSVLGKRNCHG